MIQRIAKDIVWSSLAGYDATLVMGRFANFFYERQSQSSRQREEQLRQEMPTTTLVRRAGEIVETKIDDERAEKLGMVVHYAFGASGGPAAAFLQRRGLGPLAAGLAVGTGMWVVVDEVANAVLGLTRPLRNGRWLPTSVRWARTSFTASFLEGCSRSATRSSGNKRSG